MENSNIISIPAVRSYLINSDIFDALDKIADEYGLPMDREEEFLDLTDAVIKGELAVSEMPAIIAKAFAVDDEKAKKIAADVAGYRLLPLREYLPEVPKQIKEWGGDISKYPELKIKRERYTIEKVLNDFIKSIDLELPVRLLKRFVFLAKSYLLKQKNADSIKKMLMRPINIGGLALSEEIADNVLTKLDQLDLSKVEDLFANTRHANEGRAIKNDNVKTDIVNANIRNSDNANTARKSTDQSDEKNNLAVNGGKKTSAAPISAPGDKKQKDKNQKNESADVVQGTDRKPLFIKRLDKKQENKIDQNNVNSDINSVAISLEQDSEDGVYHILKKIKQNTTAAKPKSSRIEPVNDTPANLPVDNGLELEAVERSSLPVKAATRAITKEVPVISGSIIDEEEEKEIEEHN
ncbi:hypothetical protein D6827_02310, partial [Candidatus Parcubacteria bacterium]